MLEKGSKGVGAARTTALEGLNGTMAATTQNLPVGLATLASEAHVAGIC